MTVAELRALLAKATPGDWEEHRVFPSEYKSALCAQGADHMIADVFVKSDAEVIVAVINALPALLDVAEALEHISRKVYCDLPGDECDCIKCIARDALAKLETP